MTRFDDPRDEQRSRPFSAALRIVGADPAVFVVAVAAVAFLLSACGGALLATGEAATRWSALAGSTRLSVYLDPQLGRSDAEGLKLRIDAIPQVAGSLLRTREVALAQVTDRGLPFAQTRPNPLPDVWLVSPAATTVDGEPFPARVARIKAALAELPGVASVRVDGQWVDWIGRWSAPLHSGLRIVVWAALGLAALGSLAVFFLAGRAVAGRTAWQRDALAAAGFLAALSAVVIAGVLLWLAIAESPALQASWRLRPAATGLDAGTASGIAGVLCLLAGPIGMILRRR